MQDEHHSTHGAARPGRTGFPGGHRLLAWLFVVAAAWPSAGHAQLQTRHRYDLYARLDPEAHVLEGRATIRFHNHSRAALADLIFHLYPNAFAHDQTVFMREGGTSIRRSRLGRRGGLDVLSLRLAGGADLLPRASTELVPRDRTQMRVRLPTPLAPGATLALEVAFRVRLPEIVARMGQSGDFVMAAQWFPKLAKLEPDGSFASFPYHGLGEFYADFADYELRVEVPERFLVAAPGRLVERAITGGLRRERYVLGSALDLAFSAYPDFHAVTTQAGPVIVDVYAPLGHARLAAEQGALAARGLEELGQTLGSYPYERLVLVLPPRTGHGASGMEYPGLILGDTVSFYTELLPLARSRQNLITTHELAHQWFPILVATHEAEQPVLDEGLAEWAGLDLLRERYGRRSFGSLMLGVPLDAFDLLRASFRMRSRVPSSLLAAYDYRADELGPAVYFRPALVLEAVARQWGRPRLHAALGRYARKQRFAHPGLREFGRAFDAGYWPGFFERVLRPALSGERDRSGLFPGKADLLDPNPVAARGRAVPDAWFGRLLYWAQAVLGALGP